MKWHGHWSGIAIEAETTEDEVLLRSLIKTLSVEPDSTYDGGILKISDQIDTGWYIDNFHISLER